MADYILEPLAESNYTLEPVEEKATWNQWQGMTLGEEIRRVYPNDVKNQTDKVVNSLSIQRYSISIQKQLTRIMTR